MTVRSTLVAGAWRRYGTVTPPPPDPGPGGPPANVGAAPPGTTAYAAPAGAVWVATDGSDTTGDGSSSDPYATLAKAVSVVPAGGTVVLRAGTYEEGTTAAASLGVVVNRAGVTIQSAPGEAVWLDGSTAETGWTADSGRWYKDIVRAFDRSPTYSRGALDGTTPGWQWVNPSFPCAPWPEQVFVDGVALQQVATLGEVTTGTFYVAGTASGTNNMTWTSSRYHIGTDPTGKTVRVGSKVAAITCTATDVTIRGIGIRRYSNSVPDFGVVKLYRDRCSMEHVVVEDCATTGVWLYTNADAVLRHVSITGCGLVGGGADRSDRTVIDACAFTGNTAGRFNSAPVSGGWKSAHCQYYTVRNSVISDNFQHGLWFDETVYQMDVVGCDMQDNGGYGGISEISEGARWLNCRITGNARGGLLIQGTNNAQVWCSTFNGNGASSFKLIQDSRRPADGTGRDSRFSLAWHEANCSWIITAFTFNNNVSADPDRRTLTSEVGYNFYVVSQESPRKGWQAFGLFDDGNLYARTVANSPVNVFLLAQDNANAAGWSTLPPVKTLMAPREARSVEIRGTAALDAGHMPTPATLAATIDCPIPLPADIAALIGVPTGTAHLGAWR